MMGLTNGLDVRLTKGGIGQVFCPFGFQSGIPPFVVVLDKIRYANGLAFENNEGMGGDFIKHINVWIFLWV